MPGGELNELFFGPVVVSLTLIESGDRLHLFVCKSEVQDVQIVPDVIDILASGYYYKSHLRMPAKNDLGRALAVFLSEFCEDGLVYKRLVAVSQRIPAHKLDIVLVECFAKLFLGEVGVRFNLYELRCDLPLCLELFYVLPLEIGDADASCFAFLICFLEKTVAF